MLCSFCKLTYHPINWWSKLIFLMIKEKVLQKTFCLCEGIKEKCCSYATFFNSFDLINGVPDVVIWFTAFVNPNLIFMSVIISQWKKSICSLLFFFRNGNCTFPFGLFNCFSVIYRIKSNLQYFLLITCINYASLKLFE